MDVSFACLADRRVYFAYSHPPRASRPPPAYSLIKRYVLPRLRDAHG